MIPSVTDTYDSATVYTTHIEFIHSGGFTKNIFEGTKNFKCLTLIAAVCIGTVLNINYVIQSYYQQHLTTYSGTQGRSKNTKMTLHP